MKYKDIPWLSDQEYQKAETQLRMQVGRVFDYIKVDDKLPIRYMYGLGAWVPGATEEFIRLAQDFSLRTRGVDKPISIDMIRKKLRG